MRWLIWFVFVLPLAIAQAQATPRITLNEPVEGVIDAENRAQIWTFYGWQNQLLSFRVQAQDGLDPIVTIRTTDDERVISNDDFDLTANRDSLLEAISVPRSGEYQVIVSGYGETTGAFILTMLPGYGTFALDERFVDQAAWRGENLNTLDVMDGIATLGVQGIAERGVLLNDDIAPLGDFYASLTVQGVAGRENWAVGLVFRHQDEENYYLLVINQRGEWRIEAIVDGEATILRDWATHPAIQAGSTSFQLGLLALGPTYTAFYDGQELNQVEDATFADVGQVGIGVESANAVGADVIAEIDRLVITRPTETSTGRIRPDSLVATSPRGTAQSLIRQGVLPPGGDLAWLIEDSFLETSTGGASRLVLVETSRFANFAMGTTIIGTGDQAGLFACGLLFKNQAETEYAVAFVDSAGGHGISQRNGETFSEGIFGINDAWNLDEAIDLVVVVLDDIALLYVNQQYIGQSRVGEGLGQVGNVALNYTGTSTTCEFNDTWVWSLDD